MPRSGWLAIGAAAAALGIPAIAAGREVVALVAAAALTCVILGWNTRMRMPRFLAPIAVGALLLAGRMALAPPDAGAPAPPVGDGPWTMVVEAVGSPRDGRQTATLSMAADDVAASETRLAATLPRYPPIEPGDVITVGGRTRERPDSPYGRYLERIGAWGTLQADRMRVVPAPAGPARRLERSRRAAGEALTRVLPEPEAGLAAGILIGLRDRVDREVAAAFTTAGVSHVVAISGWNIAIVAAAIGALAGRLGRRRRAIVTSLAIVGYIAFAGASPSVLRAGAMAGVVLLARESGRSGRAASALGWAALLLLIADPGLVGDAGFQLSTLATAGLIAWATPTAARLDRLTRGHLPGWLTESLGVSLAAQLATLPVVLASFGRIALIAPGINLLVVPLVAPVMAAAIVALAGGLLLGFGAPAALGMALAVPAWVGLRLMIALVDAAAAVPFASLEVQPPVGALLALALTATIVAVMRFRADPPTGAARRARHGASPGAPGPAARRGPAGALTRSRRIAVLAVVAALACTGAIAATRPQGVARLTVLDVGQGDAILVEGSRGGRVLVDGGPDPDRLLIELDRRLPPWDRRIDVVILSHPHEDHVAGLALLLARYRVGRVLEPGMRGPGPGYSAWLATLTGASAPMRGAIAAGDRLRVDDIHLEVRWPLRGSVPVDPPDTGTGINNVSVVLLGTVGERRFLLTGDVEEDVDPSLVAAGLPTVDVLKVAHHGSRTATTDAFLATVRPRVAIASAGAGNPYGHPTRATIDRLTATGAQVYRTDVDGSVTVLFEPSGPVIRRDPRAGTAARAVQAAVIARVAARPAAFLCAIPGFGDPSPAAPISSPDPGRGAVAAASPTRADPDDPAGPSQTVGYHRPDDGPLTDRGRCPAALPGSPILVPRARARRGGGRGIPGGPDRAPWDRAGPSGRGGRRPAPRRGQAGPRRRSGPSPPTRRRVRGMADAPGPP